VIRFYSPPGIGYTRKSECEINGEHWGDPVTVWNHPSGYALEEWKCCGDTEVLGEIFDCDTCLNPGIRDGAMPPGWVEDSNGFHCERCQP
jgi:hypothetical protein